LTPETIDFLFQAIPRGTIERGAVRCCEVAPNLDPTANTSFGTKNGLRDEMNVTRQPVELGDSNRARLPVAAGLGQLWSVEGKDNRVSPSLSDTDVGGGVEYALTNNWTIRGEYLHADLGKSNFNSIGNAAAATFFPGVFATGHVSYNASIARAAVNYKFRAFAPILTEAGGRFSSGFFAPARRTAPTSRRSADAPGQGTIRPVRLA
jgi:hypothetical protein